MPSTLTSAADQRAFRLFEELGQSRVNLDAVSFEQSCALKRVCAAKVRKISKDVERHLAKGQTGRARREQAKLLRGLAARLHASYEALGDEARQLRRRGKYPRTFSFPYIWGLAQRLNNDHAISIATARSKWKRDGSRRRYFVFNVFGIARQKLLLNALSPFARSHPSQFLCRGGRSAACKTLLVFASDPALQNGFFVKADVDAYFDSISHEYLEEMLPAPKAVIRKTILLDGWRFIGSAMGQRGIPQGSSVSSLVGEMVMSDVLASAADQLPTRLITYADDIGGLVPVEEDAISLSDVLKHAFRTHGAGPFSVEPTVRPLTHTSRFLGYEFSRSSDGTFEVNAPPGKSDAEQIKLMNEFADARTEQDLTAICKSLQSFHAAYPLARDVQEMTRETIGFIRAELEHRFGETTAERDTRTSYGRAASQIRAKVR